MPIEIKELHIRVSVNSPPATNPAGAPGPAAGEQGEAREALIAECVERVLEILHDRKER